MIDFECIVGCKTCLKSNGVTEIVGIPNPKENLYSQGITKSNYGISKVVRNKLMETNYKCSFCNSENIDIIELKRKGKKINVDEEVSQFQIAMSRNENGEIAVNFGGSTYLPPNFVTTAAKMIIEEIEAIPIKDFEYLTTSDAFFKVSTESYFIDGDFKLIERIENFRFYGFRKDELIDNINYAIEQLKKSNPSYPF